MKKRITIALILVLMISLVGIPAQAKKAGEIKDDIYTDADYGFSFKVPAGWSAKVKSSKKVLRVNLEQKSPVPPRHFQSAVGRDYMQIPNIKIIVDTTSLAVDDFIDNFLNDKFKSKQKKGLMKYLTLISKAHEIQKRKKLTMGDAKALVLEGRQAYKLEIGSGGDFANVINDFKSGAIFLTVREGKVYIIHMICEYQTSGPIMSIFGELLSTLKFIGAAEKPTEDTSG